MSSAAIDILREAAAYIQRHRNALFVIYLDSSLLKNLETAEVERLLGDIALLHCYGIRVIVVFGVRDQLNQILEEKNIPSIFGDHDTLRVTTEEQLKLIEKVVKEDQSRLAAIFHHAMIRHGADESRFGVIVDQWLVMAKPYGVHDGIDHRMTGVVNKIHTKKLQPLIDLGNLVLLSPLAPSSRGRFYNLRGIEVALTVSAAMTADKFIVIGHSIPDRLKHSYYHSEEFYRQIDRYIERHPEDNDAYLLRNVVQRSLEQNIGRIHFIEPGDPDALLAELFTHSGAGMLIGCDPYEQFRTATESDIDSLTGLYRGGERSGELLDRGRDRILEHIDEYHLLLCDQLPIGAVALREYQETGLAEIYGLCVHPEYRLQGRGKRLMLSLIEKARQKGIDEVFVLTTRAQNFFVDLEMRAVDPEYLPKERIRQSPNGRGSKVYALKL